MPYSSDYRLYLDANFRDIKGNIREIKKGQGSMQEELAKVLIQTTQTNSRVTHLEEFKGVGEGIIKTRVTRDEFAALCEEVKECKDKIRGVDDEIFEYKFFKKYPKSAIVLLIAILAFLGLSLLGTINTVHSKKSNADILNKIEQLETSLNIEPGDV